PLGMARQDLGGLVAVLFLHRLDEIVAAVGERLSHGRRRDEPGEQQSKTKVFHDLSPISPLDRRDLAEQGSTSNEREDAILGEAARQPRSRRMGGAVRRLRSL